MKKFIIERCGIEAKTWLQLGVNTNNLSLHRCQKVNPTAYWYTTFSAIQPIAELLIKNLLDKEYSALQVGRFQKCEVHQWMYDRYSLSS